MPARVSGVSAACRWNFKEWSAIVVSVSGTVDGKRMLGGPWKGSDDDGMRSSKGEAEPLEARQTGSRNRKRARSGAGKTSSATSAKLERRKKIQP